LEKDFKKLISGLIEENKKLRSSVKEASKTASSEDKEIILEKISETLDKYGSFVSTTSEDVGSLESAANSMGLDISDLNQLLGQFVKSLGSLEKVIEKNGTSVAGLSEKTTELKTTFSSVTETITSKVSSGSDNSEKTLSPVLENIKNLNGIVTEISREMDIERKFLETQLMGVENYTQMIEKANLELGQLTSIQRGLAARVESGEFSDEGEKGALIYFGTRLQSQIESLERTIVQSASSSPNILKMKESFSEFDKTLNLMNQNISYREKVTSKIEDMSWMQSIRELKVIEQEKLVLKQQEEVLKKQIEELETKKDAMTAAEYKEAQDILIKKMDDIESSREKVKSRGEKLEEKRKEGPFANFLKKLKGSFDNLADGIRKASQSWITKVLGALLIVGFLIKKGLLDGKTIAKILSFIIKALIAGVKMAIGLIWEGIKAVISTIFNMFMSGDIFGGLLVSLIAIIASLVILGKVIGVATALWSSISVGLGALKTSIGMVSNVFNSKFVEAARGKLLGGISGMFSGLTSSISKMGGEATSFLKDKLGIGKEGGFLSKIMPKKKDGPKSGSILSKGAKEGAGKGSGFLDGLAKTLERLGTTEALRGAATIALLAGSLLMLSVALVKFNQVEWESMGKAAAALAGLVGFAWLVAQMKNPTLTGAYVIGILAASLLATAYALAKFNEVGVEAMINAGVTLLGLVGIARIVGDASTEMIKGAAVIALLGVALIPAAYAMSMLENVDVGKIIAFTVSIGLLAGIFALAGAGIAAIAVGAGAIALMSIALVAFAFAMNIALKQIADFNVLIAFATMLGLMAATFAIVGLYSPLIIPGAIAVGAMGLALIPFAKAMEIISGTSIDIEKIKLLDEAIGIMAWRAVKESLLSPLMIVGSIAIRAMGFALIPFAKAMEILSRTSFNIEKIKLLDEAIRIMAWRAVAEAPFSGLLAIGSLAISLLGKTLMPFAKFMETLSNSNINPQQMLAFSHAVSSLTDTAVFAGLFAPLMILGGIALGYLAKSLLPLAKTMQNLIGIHPNVILSFAYAVKTLTSTAIYAGIFYPFILLGSKILPILALSMMSFSNVMNSIKDVPYENMIAFANSVRSLMATSVQAGLLFPLIALGSLALGILGNSLQGFGESFANIRGLKKEDIDSFEYGIRKMMDLVSGIGVIEGIKFIAKVKLLSGSLEQVGQSLKPLSEVFFNMKGFDPEILWGIADSMDYFISSMINLQVADPEMFINVFGKIMSIDGDLQIFSEILSFFADSMEKTNKETNIFLSSLERMAFLAEPLNRLSEALYSLSGAVVLMGDSLSSLSDEEMLRIIRVASVVGAEKRVSSVAGIGNQGRNIANGIRKEGNISELGRSGTAINGRKPKIKENGAFSRYQESANHVVEMLSRDGIDVSVSKVESVNTKANIPVSAVIDGKTIDLTRFHNEKEKENIMVATKMAARMRGDSYSESPDKKISNIGAYGSAISESPRTEVSQKRGEVTLDTIAIRDSQLSEAQKTNETLNILVEKNEKMIRVLGGEKTRGELLEGTRKEKIESADEMDSIEKTIQKKEKEEKSWWESWFGSDDEEEEQIVKEPKKNNRGSPSSIRPSSSIMTTNTDNTILSEIKSVLMQTKELHEQFYESKSNASTSPVVMQNNTNISNRTTQQSSVSRPLRPVDPMASRLRYKNNI